MVVIGIAAFSRIRGAMPRLVAMVPRQEQGEEGELEVTGMDLIVIPYAAEVRDIAALQMGTTDGTRLLRLTFPISYTCFNRSVASVLLVTNSIRGADICCRGGGGGASV